MISFLLHVYAFQLFCKEKNCVFFLFLFRFRSFFFLFLFSMNLFKQDVLECRIIELEAAVLRLQEKVNNVSIYLSVEWQKRERETKKERKKKGKAIKSIKMHK